MELSQAQQSAVLHQNSPVLVVAGAGSGKTRTLTAKIAYLIDQGMDPERILAITFTNKAAEEMKDRLMQLTGLGTNRFPWVRTFHSACFRILRIHCDKLGFSPPLQVYATHQQQKTIKDIAVGRMNLDKKWVPIIAAEISNAKNTGNPENYFRNQKTHGVSYIEEVYRLYRAALLEKNAVDFDDILFLTRNLLRDHEETRRYYQNLFDFILCDEYQDTNNLQEELTSLLVRDGRLFCVGDDWQAIYSFRGSNVSHFLNFQKNYPGARIFKLEQNYRSTDEIVSLANKLIQQNKTIVQKNCFSKSKGGTITIECFDNDREEARWVASKILEMKRDGMDYQQVAVLYRTKFCSLSFEQAFRSLAIPYKMLGGKGFFERKEVMDINSYLSAAVFPKDDTSFERILNIPKRGIGPAAIKKIAASQQEGMGLQEAARICLNGKVLQPKVYQAIAAVLSILDRIRDMKPDEAIRTLIDAVGYMGYLQEYAKGDSMDFTQRKENIDQLVFSASSKDNLVEYLEEAALVREDTHDGDEDQGNQVKLSTIHAAKGLEFHSVFVIGCEENLFPHWKCSENQAGVNEERRLMYVAMTRAARHLFITYADFRKGQFNPRSRFIDEIETSMDEPAS